MHALLTTLPDTLAISFSELLPWQKGLVAVLALIILYKVISFQIGMIIKLIITIAIVAAVAYVIMGNQ